MNPFFCQWIQCSFSCNRRSQMINNLVEQHYDKDADEKKCLWTNCIFLIDSLESFKSHASFHANNLLYSCRYDGCEKNFKSRGSLRDHRCTHLNYKPNKCHVSECKKQFTRASDLNKHFKCVHLGEKAYICQICSDKYYSSRSALRRHLTQSHSEIFKPEVSGKTINITDSSDHLENNTAISISEYLVEEELDFFCK
ncbi:MAG: hypothetical protein MHPSP_001042 [Paramarteilia canceri]